MTARTFEAIRREIGRLRESGLTWREIARRHYPGIAEARMAANLCAIYKHGREPNPSDIRIALGLKRRRRYRDLWDMPTALLAEMIKNRR